MIQGQIHQAAHKYPLARAAFAAGIKACPKETTLWVLASRLEEADGKSIKARALLDKARLVNPASEELWAEAVGVEERSGSPQQAKALLARGLQECPTSGPLWALAIWSEPRPTRKSRSVDALKKSADNPVIICTVARLFWAERKVEKARQWFGRAVATNPDLGDSWGWWLRFERQHGTPVSIRTLPSFDIEADSYTQEYQAQVVDKCVAEEPHHSPMWQSIAKDDKNAGKSVKEILELVADALEQS